MVLRLLAAGHTNRQIGQQLFISPKTASVHVTSILRKLAVHDRVQAAAVAVRLGLVNPPVPGSGSEDSVGRHSRVPPALAFNRRDAGSIVTWKL